MAEFTIPEFTVIVNPASYNVIVSPRKFFCIICCRSMNLPFFYCLIITNLSRMPSLFNAWDPCHNIKKGCPLRSPKLLVHFAPLTCMSSLTSGKAKAHEVVAGRREGPVANCRPAVPGKAAAPVNTEYTR